MYVRRRKVCRYNVVLYRYSASWCKCVLLADAQSARNSRKECDIFSVGAYLSLNAVVVGRSSRRNRRIDVFELLGNGRYRLLRIAAQSQNLSRIRGRLSRKDIDSFVYTRYGAVLGYKGFVYTRYRRFNLFNILGMFAYGER